MPAAAEMMTGETLSPDMPETVTMGIEAEIDLYDFNQPVEVEAPEGAQIIDPAMLGGDF